MSKKQRMIFGVVAAEVNSIEQRKILNGIAQQAKTVNVDIAVISNVYNPNVSNSDLVCENKIYDLILMPELDGIILISEPFVNTELQKNIRQYISSRNIPIIVIGSYIQEFDLPECRFINSSDENDLMDVTEHLICEHGYTNIDMLTGYDFLEVSQQRANGYRKALKKHGIIVNENKIHYGNFWHNSGSDLVKQYLSGELPMPEALVCANDYMAYGVLDEFAAQGINILDKIALIGYDFVPERNMHTPLLTSYERSRTELGKNAVQILYDKLVNNTDRNFSPPKGKIITGITCQCSFYKASPFEELEIARTKHQYNDWLTTSQMEQHLTKCRTLDELAKTAGEFQYLIRFVQNIYLCLFEKWYDPEKNNESDILNCRSIMPWLDPTKFRLNRNELTEICAMSDNPAIYYYSPIFFEDRLFGYIILKYDNPDTYDDIFRNWLKAVSNGLEFLRMKNDIRYLTQCLNLSDTHDSITGFLNEKGMENARQMIQASQDGSKKSFFVLLKILLNSDDFSDINKTKKTAAIMDTADAVRQFSSGYECVCGRVGNDFFLCYIQSADATEQFLVDNLTAMLVHHKDYMKNYGMDSFICTASELNGSENDSEINQICAKAYQKQVELLHKRRHQNLYKKMLEIRNIIYLNPDEDISADDICRQFSYSPGYMRAAYKNCFGISFHQDCINSRLSMAKYLLATTNMTIAAIADKCGYCDQKYFIRQFLTGTGITPNQYRTKLT